MNLSFVFATLAIPKRKLTSLHYKQGAKVKDGALFPRGCVADYLKQDTKVD